jgi:hypothetical protein
VAAVAAHFGMRIGMDLDTVIVNADRVENGQVETLRVETHGGEVRFVFPAKAISPISLLGKRLVEMVIDVYGPRTIWHPSWCRCAECQDLDRMERAHEAETDRQWDAWCGR